MSEEVNKSGEFIDQAEALILANVGNEHFGVSELAGAMNMSRSNLLRKIKKSTGKSASQFIREIRLKKGMELLKETSRTVSEISYDVGFGSTAYFIKCFREQYGEPPGERRTGEWTETIPVEKKRNNIPWILIPAASVLLIVFAVLLFREKEPPPPPIQLEKSIAVLPFKNESNDSTNLYFVNGLMESALNNLQRIEDLRVISRTSVEKYRDSDMTIPEIANELNVSYIVEGSGQKIGDDVLLNIQLIEAANDKHIWAEQYSRKVSDIFTLQNEVAQKITDAIQVIVTPAELEQIEKKPTNNLQAYDYYLQALDPYYSRSPEGLEKSITLFGKAIEEDPQFALAYAHTAIAYYYLDRFHVEKKFAERINNFADKALLYDSRSPISLIAKALYYMHVEEYRLALPHLEKALEYNPNSADVMQLLSALYSYYIPNTAKYLEYALMGIKLDVTSRDSVERSNIYLNLSGAFIQNGFVDEAMHYIDQSLLMNPDNYYSPYLRAMILYARDGDLERTTNLLVQEWALDTGRLDLMQEIAKMYYSFRRNTALVFTFIRRKI